jgi:hypothetical protein
MDQSAQSGVRVEREVAVPGAIIFGGGTLASELGHTLRQQGLSVSETPMGDHHEEFEAARYAFFFLAANNTQTDWKRSLSNAVLRVSRGKGKLLMIFDNVSKEEADEAKKIIKENGWPFVTVEINGFLTPNSSEEIAAVGKLVRIAFSSRTEDSMIIIGNNSSYQMPPIVSDAVQPTDKQYFPSFSDLPLNKDSLRLGETKKAVVGKVKINKKSYLVVRLFILLGMIVSPVVFFLSQVIFGMWQLKQAQDYLLAGRYFEAQGVVKKAGGMFAAAKSTTDFFAVVTTRIGLKEQTEKVYELLTTAKVGSDILSRAIVIAPQVASLPGILLGHTDGEEDLNLISKKIVLEGESIDRELGFIEAEWNSGTIQFVTRLAGLMGLSSNKIDSYFGQIASFRQMIRSGRAIASVLPEIVPNAGRKTYLVVFQNSAELRPTGGFIGSYAIVHFDSGRLLDYKINDVYSADGQLRGRVAPPDEILHYLGQPNWFMRDANFAADFPLTAKRLEWFLEKETGQNVDGVVAVNLGAVQKILEATGGVRVDGMKELVTAGNFFQKAEYAAEINFFPGSTQKRDFLGQVGEEILNQATGESGKKNWLALGKALSKSLYEKEILFYFNSKPVQEVVENNEWAGGIRTGECEIGRISCSMIVEANFGANKSNYFLKQNLQIESTIHKGGEISEKISLNLINDSPSDSWPGGTYKNYLRFLTPIGSKMISVSLGDSRTATVSSVLSAEVLAKLRQDQFLVFQSMEPGTIKGVATTSAYQSFGMLVEVPPHNNRVVNIEVSLPTKVDFRQKQPSIDLKYLKQPGNNIHSFRNTINYPSFLTLKTVGRNEGMATIASEQKVEYNTDLSRDRRFSLVFER